MQTRQDNNLWPFNHGIDIDFQLLGRKPPTTEDILVKFRSLHYFNQDQTNRHSTLKEAADAIATEAQNWWITAGYQVKRKDQIQEAILKLDNEWKCLEQDHNKVMMKTKKLTPAMETKENKFKENAKKTFRVVPLGYQKYLEVSAVKTTDAGAKQKFEEDLQFLKNMHNNVGDDRIGSIGSFDRELASSKKSTPSQGTSGAATSSSETITTQQSVSRAGRKISTFEAGHSDSETSSSLSEQSHDPDFVLMENATKRKKKDNIFELTINKKVLKKASLQADVDGGSVRKQLKYTTALVQAAGGNIDDMPLSKPTIQRYKIEARHEKVKEVKETEQAKILSDDHIWVLHWDGKTFNKKTHAGKKKPVLAVVLKSLNDDDEIVVDVIDMSGMSGSDMECKSVLDALQAIGFDVKRIIALIFDTTAVNSGHKTGITVQLQHHIDHAIMQIACRHHTMELVCGGAASTVYGETESPYEVVFKNYAGSCESINIQDYRVFSTSNRKLNALKDSVLNFLLTWLEKSANIRENYKKWLELSILFLVCTFPQGYKFTFKAPGAFHHARWMARIIYTVMIALFQHQLAEDEVFSGTCNLDRIWSLAAFLTLFYVKHWFTAPKLVDAAVNDLELWNSFNDITMLSAKQLRGYPEFFQEMAVAAC